MSLPGPIVAIVGPTASGKSALAEEVACRLGSSVVSVDAMQVYRGMDIGTAKVPLARRRCPLLMVDVADVDADYSAKLFQRHGRACVDKLIAAGKTPILCGGTGLYLNAIVSDMRFPAGEAGDSRRQAYERLLAEEGPERLYARLCACDPQSAAIIHPNNSRRVIRALELFDEGLSYATHHEGLKELDPCYDVRIWGIDIPRPLLYERIDRRVDEMFAQGLVDEVRSLRGQGLGQSRTAAQAIGYKEVLEALDGLISMDEARSRMKLRTRHYAKRQISWFRRDGRVRWMSLGEGLDTAVCAILDDLDTAPDEQRNADGAL